MEENSYSGNNHKEKSKKNDEQIINQEDKGDDSRSVFKKNGKKKKLNFFPLKIIFDWEIQEKSIEISPKMAIEAK